MIKQAIAASVLVVGMWSAQAAAVFTDRAAFEAALAGTVATETFDCGGCSFQYLGSGSIGYNGVNYATSGGNNFLIGSYYGSTVSGTDFMQIENSSATVSFGSDVRAIGMDVDSLFSDYTFTLSFGGESISVSSTAGQHRFLGIIADGAFSTAAILSTTILQFDNLTTATDAVASVPEPGTLALALPLVGAMVLRRRRQAGRTGRVAEA